MYKYDMNNNSDEIRMLNRLRSQAESRMALRYHIIILYLKGYLKTKLAEMFGVSYYTIRNYTKSYDSKGIEGLMIGKSTGAKRKLTVLQEQELFDCITTKLPKDVGFAPFVNWTAPLACKWVENTFFVKLSERGMRDIFYRLKISYTRPTYTLKKADPVKQEAFRAEFEVIKKN